MIFPQTFASRQRVFSSIVREITQRKHFKKTRERSSQSRVVAIRDKKYETERTTESTLERERKRAQRKNRNGNECKESIRQSGPVAKTPFTHEHVQTHVPGILFRGGDVRNVLSLREGEERKREEEALERERFKPSRSSIEYYLRKRKQRRHTEREEIFCNIKTKKKKSDDDDDP